MGRHVSLDLSTRTSAFAPTAPAHRRPRPTLQSGSVHIYFGFGPTVQRPESWNKIFWTDSVTVWRYNMPRGYLHFMNPANFFSPLVYEVITSGHVRYVTIGVGTLDLANLPQFLDNLSSRGLCSGVFFIPLFLFVIDMFRMSQDKN